jgi:putative ubiquitin-RnfH superfamily antitoxin RatB of RatAB toxin-antitoxin module
MAETLEVQVIYVEPDRQIRRMLSLAVGSTVADAIAASGIEREIGGINPERIGIFNQRVKRDQRLQAGDRIEIYRPLLVDPKQARRMRAKKTR